MESWPQSFDAHQMLMNAQNAVTRATTKAGSFLNANRYMIPRTFVLLLRFGQVAATAILMLIYFFFVYNHHTHYCHYSPHFYGCKYERPKLAVVPWSYVFVLTASIASALQLVLVTFLKLRTFTSSAPSNIQVAHIRPHAHYYGFLLTPSDIIILILYVVAFVSLSDYVVPTGILRGARSGSTCYWNNQYNRYAPVVLQQCVLGQHGYWWTMGAMLSYLITSILYGVVFVETSTLKRSANGTRGAGPISLPDEPLEQAENMPLLGEDTAEGDLLIAGES